MRLCDQKLNILDQYRYPKLVFPMNTTPLGLLKPGFFEIVDMVISQGVQKIAGLPAVTPLPVLPYWTHT